MARPGGPGDRGQGPEEVRVDEEVDIAVHLALDRFLGGEEEEMEFPSSFTSTERAFVHCLSRSLGLISKSKGKGAHRYLTVRKKGTSAVTHAEMTCCLASSTKRTIWNSIQRFPVTRKERTELRPKTERGNACAVESENRGANKTGGRLSSGIPQVPVKRGESEFDSLRQSLPVFEKQDEIVKLIKDNKVDCRRNWIWKNYTNPSVPSGRLLLKWDSLLYILHSAETSGSRCCG